MSEVTKNDKYAVNEDIKDVVKDAVTADVPASHESTASVETSASQKQADAINAEKDAKSEVVMSTLKNVLPQWARKLVENPIIPAVAVGMFAGPLAGVATFGAGTLGKQFVKMNDTINAYKNKLVEDKDIKLNKDGTLAYTGTSTIMGTDIYKPTVWYKPKGMNPTGVDAEDKSSYDVPKPHQPQSPPSVDDDKKKEESKKEEVKKEDPKKETSKKEEPKKEEPKKEEVKQEAPKTEEPKKEEVKPAEPKQEAPTIPEPVGGVNPTVPENQPTVEIPAPINPAPTTETKSAESGDVIVTKPRVIKVGEKEDAEEVDSKNKEASTGDKEHTTDSDVGIWENRDDIDPNDTKDNKGGDYSHNDDNKSVSSAYQDLIKSIAEPSVPSVDDGPDL